MVGGGLLRVLILSEIKEIPHLNFASCLKLMHLIPN